MLMDNFWVTLVIVLLVYIGLAIGFIPKMQANRTTITLIGVGLLLVLKQINIQQIGGFLISTL